MVQTWNTDKKYRGQVGPLGLITTGGRVRRKEQAGIVRRMAVLLVVGILFLFTATMALARRNGSNVEVPAHVAVTVQTGDTLWKLAHRYGNPSQYILERVDALANENNLSASSVLQPGQRIWIPVSDAADLKRIQSKL